MKTIAIALIGMLVGVYGKPYDLQQLNVQKQENINRIIDGILESVFEMIRGLDPLVVEWSEGEYISPIDGIFSSRAFIRNFILYGFSAPDVFNFGFADNTISFDVKYPEIGFSLDEAVTDLQALSYNGRIEIRGRFAIKELRFAGQLQLGLFEDILDGLSLQFSLGGMESQLYVNIIGIDLSQNVNDILGTDLPAILIENEELLNRLLVELIRFVISGLI